MAIPAIKRVQIMGIYAEHAHFPMDGHTRSDIVRNYYDANRMLPTY